MRLSGFLAGWGGRWASLMRRISSAAMRCVRRRARASKFGLVGLNLAFKFCPLRSGLLLPIGHVVGEVAITAHVNPLELGMDARVAGRPRLISIQSSTPPCRRILDRLPLLPPERAVAVQARPHLLGEDAGHECGFSPSPQRV